MDTRITVVKRPWVHRDNQTGQYSTRYSLVELIEQAGYVTMRVIQSAR